VQSLINEIYPILYRKSENTYKFATSANFFKFTNATMLFDVKHLSVGYKCIFQQLYPCQFSVQEIIKSDKLGDSTTITFETQHALVILTQPPYRFMFSNN